MATGKLTSTVFIAGPEDKLGVVDVYEQSSDSIINSFQEEFHKVSDSLDDFLSGVKDIGKSIKQGIQSGLDFINNNLNAVNSAINSAFGMVNGVINQVSGTLNGLVSKPIKLINDVLGTGGSLAKNFVGSINNLSQGLKTQINLTESIIGKVSNRLSGSLSNQGRNSLLTTKPTTLKELLGNSIVNYGALNPMADTLSSSINNDLDHLLGGDRGMVTAITRPSINRASTLAEPSNYDAIGSLEFDQLLENISNPELSGSMKSLSPEAQTLLTRGLKTDQVFNNKITLDGKVSNVDPQVSNQNKEALADILNVITEGNFEVKSKNNGIETNILSGVIHLASKAGFPRPFESIAKHKTTDLMVEVAKPLLHRAVEEGDFELINDIGRTSISKELANIVPNLINETKIRIKKPELLSQQEYSSYYKEVKHIFETIDPLWRKYKSGKIEAINACGLAENPFFADLIEAQLNELKKPLNNSNKIQTAYPLNGVNNPTKLLNEIGLPEPTISYDDVGNEVVIPPIKYVKPELLPIDPDNFKDEPFLLLGKVFLNHTVDSELKKHFPYFYETLETTPVLPMS